MNFVPSMPEGAKSKTGTIAAAGIASFIGAILIAPFVFLAIGGIVGLVVALGLGYASLKFAPVFGMKVSNAALKAIRKEAYDNPVPTLLNEYRERQADLNKEITEAEDLNNAIGVYASKQVEMRRNFPADAPLFEAHLQAMQNVLDQQYQAVAEAQVGLTNFDKEIKRAEAIWDMSLVANKVATKAGRVSPEAVLRKIKTETALDSVRDSMGASFAKLDHVSRMRKNVLQQPAGSPMLAQQPDGVFIPPVNIQQKETVKR